MTSELEPAERHHLCRLCLTTDQDDLYPIFGGGIPDLAEQIYDCTTVEINYIEGIPAWICKLCRSKIMVCHQFVESCQRADRKFHRLYRPQFRQHKRFKQDLENGVENRRLIEPMTRIVNWTPGGDREEQLALPTKVPAVVHRLKNDDKLRRYSIDDDRKFAIKKRRLSKPADTSIELIAAKIEQSLKQDDTQDNESGKRMCPQCGKQVVKLNQHMLLHSTLPKYVCNVCNKEFGRKSNFNYHLNLHTGEKPYKCLRCEAGFSCPTKLYKHKKSHEDYPNYRLSEDHRFHCNVCHSVFKHRKLIDQHMLTDHCERKHPCEICGKAFFTRKNLNRHLNRVHKKDNAAKESMEL